MTQSSISSSAQAEFFSPRPPVIQALTEALVSEILLAFGLGRAAHSKILRRIAQIPAARFTRLIDQFDQRICREGLPAAARWITALHSFGEGAGKT